jgi:hypothetical protein
MLEAHASASKFKGRQPMDVASKTDVTFQDGSVKRYLNFI